jgi:hypothetical protein
LLIGGAFFSFLPTDAFFVPIGPIY